MGKPVRPRFGSMGVWPRKRSINIVSKVRSIAKSSKPKILAFPVYKAGMTHTNIVGQQKGKRSHGTDTAYATTVLECPPIKIASVRLYKKEGLALKVAKQINFKVDKELNRKLTKAKDDKISNPDELDKLNLEEYEKITVQIYTNPKSIDLKKTPDLFEVELGGKKDEQIKYIKENTGKPIQITDVFNEGQLVDAHAVTKGKGFQGPVKRFGIGFTSHRSEKARRNPGSLGGWKGQAHVMYRVAHAGQTGFHQRTQYNNLIMKIGDKPEEVNPKGGFINYGNVKASYILIKGTIPGPKKRLITLTEPLRQKKQVTFSSESIKNISTASKQGR